MFSATDNQIQIPLIEGMRDVFHENERAAAGSRPAQGSLTIALSYGALVRPLPAEKEGYLSLQGIAA